METLCTSLWIVSKPLNNQLWSKSVWHSDAMGGHKPGSTDDGLVPDGVNFRTYCKTTHLKLPPFLGRITAWDGATAVEIYGLIARNTSSLGIYACIIPLYCNASSHLGSLSSATWHEKRWVYCLYKWLDWEFYCICIYIYIYIYIYAHLCTETKWPCNVEIGLKISSSLSCEYMTNISLAKKRCLSYKHNGTSSNNRVKANDRGIDSHCDFINEVKQTGVTK